MQYLLYNHLTLVFCDIFLISTGIFECDKYILLNYLITILIHKQVA